MFGDLVVCAAVDLKNVGCGNNMDKSSKIVPVAYEILGEKIETRWIGTLQGNVVDRLDEGSTEHESPYAIDCRSSERIVLAMRDPRCQLFAPIPLGREEF